MEGASSLRSSSLFIVSGRTRIIAATRRQDPLSRYTAARPPGSAARAVAVAVAVAVDPPVRTTPVPSPSPVRRDRVALAVRARTMLGADDRDEAVPLQFGQRAVHPAEPQRARGAKLAVI